MPRLKKLNAKEVYKILLRVGFFEHHIHGSHINLRHISKPYLRVVIPFHNKILAPKTLKSIIIQAELSSDEIKNFFN